MAYLPTWERLQVGILSNGTMQSMGCGRLTVLLMQVCQHHGSTMEVRIQWDNYSAPVYQYVYINSWCSLSILAEPLDTTKSWCRTWLRKFRWNGRSHGKNCSKQLGHICTGNQRIVDHIIESVDSICSRGVDKFLRVGGLGWKVRACSAREILECLRAKRVRFFLA